MPAYVNVLSVPAGVIDKYVNVGIDGVCMNMDDGGKDVFVDSNVACRHMDAGGEYVFVDADGVCMNMDAGGECVFAKMPIEYA